RWRRSPRSGDGQRERHHFWARRNAALRSMLKPHKPGLRAIISRRSCSLIQHAAAFRVIRPSPSARSLTRSTLLRRQCHAVLFRVTGALYLALEAGSAAFCYPPGYPRRPVLKTDWRKTLISLARPKRFELLTPRFVG